MAKRQRKKISEEVMEARIESYSHDLRGIARINGKVVFILGAIVGELVRFRYTKKKRDYAEGVVVDVVEESNSRREPRCPVFGCCGGCSLQHMSWEHEVAAKEKVVLDIVQRIGGIRPKEVLDPILGSEYGYRRSCRLGVRFVPKKGGVLVGFRERNSHYITDMDQCPVLTHRISDLIPVLRQTLSRLSIPDKIPQVEAYGADNGVFLVIRHLGPLTNEDVHIMAKFEKEHKVKIFLQPKGPDSVHPLTQDAFDEPYYDHPELGVRIYFQPGDFIQVNGEVNEKMVLRVLRWLEPSSEDIILDLFSGLGNFSIPIGKAGAKVFGVEVEEGMVKKARLNAQRNGVSQAVFLRRDLYKQGIDGIVNNGSSIKVLIDPPRTGAKEVVTELSRWRPKRVVYVSCNPATFSRDAGILVTEGGYELRSLGIADMFPQTRHVETIGLFER